MNDPNQLSQQFAQQAAQMGISGNAVIECVPEEGFMRMKINWEPPERQAELTKGLGDTMASVMQMMGLQVKIRHQEGGK